MHGIQTGSSSRYTHISGAGKKCDGGQVGVGSVVNVVAC